jgi:hypothetical protein
VEQYLDADQLKNGGEICIAGEEEEEEEVT